MSRIAIIDTAVDTRAIGGREIRHINLCGESDAHADGKISHGTLCAMVLDHCASDYELINIQIFKENKLKVFGDIELLVKALKFCREQKVDIVSLSAVSSILSDSKLLFDITQDLVKKIIIVSALDNRRYFTVPTGYAHVLGVQADNGSVLCLGEMAYQADDPLGANIYANCDFALLAEQEERPSNSFAVPVVAAYVNSLVNQGKTVTEISSALKKLKPYCSGGKYKELYYTSRTISREIPVIFLVDQKAETCRAFMDDLYYNHEVQSTALSFVESPYDARIKKVRAGDSICEELSFMCNYYKTDMVFVVGREDRLQSTSELIDIDVVLSSRDNHTLIRYNGISELVRNSNVSDSLVRILTG
jgi:hypothetical protein